jgi:hypothetical protein
MQVLHPAHPTPKPRPSNSRVKATDVSECVAHIETLRRAFGLSKVDLATLSGVSGPAICNIVNRKVDDPHFDSLLRLYQALDHRLAVYGFDGAELPDRPSNTEEFVALFASLQKASGIGWSAIARASGLSLPACQKSTARVMASSLFRLYAAIGCAVRPVPNQAEALDPAPVASIAFTDPVATVVAGSEVRLDESRVGAPVLEPVAPSSLSNAGYDWSLFGNVIVQTSALSATQAVG